jgi:hypothetical protein
MWNYYNRVSVTTIVTDSAASWTYTGATVHTSNSSVGNRISFVNGFAEDGISASFLQQINAPSGGAGFIGLGLDTTTVFDKYGAVSAVGSGIALTPSVTITYAPQLGGHFVQALEAADGVNTATFFAGNRYGLSAGFRM